MKEEFRKWLIEEARPRNAVEKGFKPNTARSYVSGINRLSRDLREDIFQIKDPVRVSKIRRLYDLNGPRRDVGDYSHGTARNAIIQYEKFVK